MSGSEQHRALSSELSGTPCSRFVLHMALFSWSKMELQPDIELSRQQDRSRGKGQRRKRARDQDQKLGA